MATSITQAKPLLTAAELELFDHSRASPIKALTAKQLAGKEKRARALRDKYRDLYRRQTVAQRGKTGKGAAAGPAADANLRTQRKADILQEVLERFEARSSQLAAREERATAAEDKAKAKAKPAARAAARTAKPSAASPARARRGASSAPAGAKPTPSPKSKLQTKPVSPATKKAARSPDPAPGAGQPARKQAAKAAPAGATSPKASRGALGRARKPRETEHPVSALAHLQDGAVHAEHLTGKDPAQRSTKAPSERAPTYGGKAQAPGLNAPLDMVASASRTNPVRQMPGNIAIHGHQSAAVRRAQGKRDSR